MEKNELDSLLQVMENPVRRRIIKRLSQEPGYALQLSKELGLGQPLVAKHLAIMERAGLVTSTMEESSTGPRRKRYSLAKSISITMDLAPNMFLERGFAIGGQKQSSHPTSEQFRQRVAKATKGSKESERLRLLADVLKEVDDRMAEMQEERLELLEVRNEAMRQAAKIAVRLELDKRRVLFHILEQHDRIAERISESLNLREFSVREILEELQKEFFD